MIYVFLADGFEEVEALTPVDMMRRAGLKVVTVGVGRQIIRGSHGILDDSIDMIFLPGGMPGTLNLEKSDYVQKSIDYCVNNDKYIAAICAAPSILGHRGLLNGKNAVCYPGFEDELKGASVLKDAVCIDEKIITSRGAGTAMKLSFEIVKLLVSEEKANELKASIIYNE